MMTIHPTHKTSAPHSSMVYDNICELCGATDAPGQRALKFPCPAHKVPVVTEVSIDQYEQPVIECPECQQRVRVIGNDPYVVTTHAKGKDDKSVCPGSKRPVQRPSPVPPPVAKTTPKTTTDEYGLKYSVENISDLALVNHLNSAIQEVNQLTEFLAQRDLELRYEIAELQVLGRPVAVKVLGPRVLKVIRGTNPGALPRIFIYECGCSLQTKHDNCPHHGAPFVAVRTLGD